MKLVFASIGYERSPNDIKVLCVAIERGMLTQVLPVSTQGMLAQLYFFSHFMVVYIIYYKEYIQSPSCPTKKCCQKGI